MNTIRRLMYRPKKSDTSYLAQFYYADEQLNSIAAELDSFDGRKDPERCTALVNQLRHSQDEVLAVIEKIMVAAVPEKSRAARDYRVKFPDDVLHESLAGQLWFGAECLAAGSSIMNREVESASMRPLAKELTQHLDMLRSQLREQCLRNQNKFTDKIIASLIKFDELFSEFELSYVSAMVPVKTMREYELLQDVTVLFCETVQRALKLGLLTQDMIDMYDPALMFTIPRLAIVCGLLVFPNGPLDPDMDPLSMSEMFRPFQTLLFKIRELLWTLSDAELNLLEKSLSTTDDIERSSSMLAELSGLTLSVSDHVGGSAGVSRKSAPLHRHHRRASLTRRDPYVSDVNNDDSDISDSEMSATSRGLMVHSDSTMTVVARSVGTGASHIGEVDAGSSSPFTTRGIAPCVISELEARRLQHSKSWPQSAEGHRSNIVATSTGLAFYGDQQFNFNLPYNTSIERLRHNHGNVPSGVSGAVAMANERFVDQGIIYLSTGDENGDGRQQQQITFVTDEFCRIFRPDVTSFCENVDDDNGDEGDCNGRETAPDGATPQNDVTPQNGALCQSVEDCTGTITDRPSFEIIACDCDPAMSELCSLTMDVTAAPDISETVPYDSDGVSVAPPMLNGASSVRESPPLAVIAERSHNITCSESPVIDNDLCKPDFSTSLPCQQLVRSCDSTVTANISKQRQQNKSGLAAVNVAHSWGCVTSAAAVGSLQLNWERASCCSSDTSSYSSECRDDEEIALAIHAAEMSARQEARSRFKNAADLIHRLFVCISGVADQLQTNYASDLRHILKFVFECNTSEAVARLDAVEDSDSLELHSSTADQSPMDRRARSGYGVEPEASSTSQQPPSGTEPPEWVPDNLSPVCTSCRAAFTFVKRRHHCRNCGKIFCAHCSSNAVPLPHFGLTKPVRVCNRCFVFHVTPFTMNSSVNQLNDNVH